MGFVEWGIKYKKKTYRGVAATYDDIIPSANAAAGKGLIGVSDIGESFDGFVDPLSELDSQTVPDESAAEETHPMIFDLAPLQ